MKTVKCALLFAGVLFLFSSVAASQEVRVKLHIGYPASGDSSDLYFGFDKDATDCIALSGGEFGEHEAPPWPFDGFEVRFGNPHPPIGDDTCFGQGSYRDYRHLDTMKQVDSFYVLMSAPAGPSANYLWTWPAGLGVYFQTLLLMNDIVFDYPIIDMLVQTSVLTPSDINRWYIIATPKVTTSIHDENQIPGAFALHQNYPNPFNPTTTIRFDLPRESDVVLKVFDVLGREVRTILNEKRIAGSYEITVDASGLPSGLYFYRILAGEFAETKKMMVVK